MSRVSLIEQLCAPKKKSALEFNYDALWAPPIRFFLTQQDIDGLYKIATSLKYNDDINKKYELIDNIMKPRGFKRGNCGTNRVVYNYLEDTSFCMKIALDRVGIKDSPREYKNQEFFKPFCCKIFEVDPTGVIACVERVNPISSLEEFLSIADDVFNMMVTKIIGKYVVDDLGTEKFMNYGLRYNSNGSAFGPVILDYPYAYELDGAKLRCSKPIQLGNKEFACGGEIDYDAGLNNLVCCKCGRHYSARELSKDDSNVLKFYSDDEQCTMRARIVRESDGSIIKESGRSSKIFMTKKEYEEGIKLFEVKNLEPRKVVKTIKNPYTPMKQLRQQYYTELQNKAHEEMKKQNADPFNPVIEPEFGPRSARRASIKNKEDSVKIESITEPATIFENEIPRVRTARRAEDIENEVDDSKESIELIIEYNIVEFESDNDEEEEEVTTNEAILEALTEVINETVESEADINEAGEEVKTTDTLGEIVDFMIKNGITDPEEEEVTTNDDNVFSEEMEADVFPEIRNQSVNIDNTVYTETDYSNYEPSEEYESIDYEYQDDEEYSDLYKVNRKDKKRNIKQQKNKSKKRVIEDDMSDY